MDEPTPPQPDLLTEAPPEDAVQISAYIKHLQSRHAAKEQQSDHEIAMLSARLEQALQTIESLRRDGQPATVSATRPPNRAERRAPTKVTSPKR